VHLAGRGVLRVLDRVGRRTSRRLPRRLDRLLLLLLRRRALEKIE
jgi:hypothetical protein